MKTKKTFKILCQYEFIDQGETKNGAYISEIMAVLRDAVKALDYIDVGLRDDLDLDVAELKKLKVTSK